ncbi:MAG: acyltransferase family protein [Saprospiraceae bacterium]
MKSNLSYFPQIDTLRFLAIIMVILSHWLPNDYWIRFFQLGRLGVELFFVISGFLITRILLQLNAKEGRLSDKLKTFYVRRILRIFPIYYFVVILTYVFNSGHIETAIWWNLFYGSNFYILKVNQFPGLMSHFWTLSVEEHFYILWPLLVLLPSSKKVIYSIGLAVFIGFFSRYFFYYNSYPPLYTNIFTLSCFDAFAIGGFLAYLREVKLDLYYKITKSKALLCSVCIGFVYSLYSLNFHGTNDNFWNLVAFRFFSAWCFLFLINYAIHSKLKILNLKQFVFLGKLSYSMYLFHNFVPGFLLGLKYPENIYFRLVIYFIVLLLVSYLSWKLIEMPFNKFKKRFQYL